MTNHLDVSVHVYSMSERGNELQEALLLLPGQTSSLTMAHAHTASKELFFGPQG